MDDSPLEDVRASDPVERLLEDSWEARSRAASRRELIVEAGAAVLFLAVALPLAVPAVAGGQLRPGLALFLVGLYAVVSRAVKFPIGAGYVVPSYLVLVPMLLMLPPTTVPVLAAAGLVLGTLGRWIVRRATAQQVLFAIPDAWHTLGPAVVLALAGQAQGGARALVYIAAFAAGCALDLVSSALRESLVAGIAPRLQGRVIALVWLVDACLAPLGVLVADAASDEPAMLLLLLPFIALLMAAERDRSARIGEAQHRLDVVARERTRLQSAVCRLGDAFAARLELSGLTDVVLQGSIDALDASAGRLILRGPATSPVCKSSGSGEFESLLERADSAVQDNGQPCQLEENGAWVLAVPFRLGLDRLGVLSVARGGRAFRDDEQALITALVERGEIAAAEILAHDQLREQAQTDPLTRLGNRRKLAGVLGERLVRASLGSPLVLMLFDLDGFKAYNDTFGHGAGDALLARLGGKLDQAVSPSGSAYRLGGDEFCVLLPALGPLQDMIATASSALEEHGERFSITASCGSVLLPHEATTADYALQLADKRMYAHKHARPSGAGDQAHDVLVRIMRAKRDGRPDHSTRVTQLAVRVGRRLRMTGEAIDELRRAATLHDIGKVGIPEAILTKAGPLEPEEWSFIRQHSLLGERILSAAPALRPIATIVRATHECWDGQGYPDRLRGPEIPLAARIVAVCDAYDAIVTDRCYSPARTPQAAREELAREAGHQFDPDVVGAFLAELDRADSDAPDTDAPHRHPRTEDNHAQLAAQVVCHVRELLQQRG